MIAESLLGNMARLLRVPPGSQLRKNYGTKDEDAATIEDNDYVSAMLQITTDDVCVSNSPLSIEYDETTPPVTKIKLEEICDAFNVVSSWIVYDLLAKGVSAFDVNISDKNKLCLVPILDDMEFYLTKSMKVLAYEVDESKSKSRSKVNLLNKIVFINYSKRDLSKIDDKDGLDANLLYKITPRAMQLSNADDTVKKITDAENAIAKYRSLLRPARWANVDIGTAQGDIQTETVNSISTAINANSNSLQGDNGDFDDNIPVLPNRKGLGKVEIASDIPSADIKELGDLNYWVGKLSLLMRFPSTYIDFSQPMGATAVSLVRGDLRYAKLIKRCGTKVTDTINEYLMASKFAKYHPVVTLQSIPTSEDDDVVAALGDHTDLAQKIEEFVQGTGDNETLESKLHRLDMLQSLFTSSTTSPVLSEWFKEYRDYLLSLKEGSEGSPDSDTEGGTDVDVDVDADFAPDDVPVGGIDLPTNDEFEAPEGEVEGEFLEPQS